MKKMTAKALSIVVAMTFFVGCKDLKPTGGSTASGGPKVKVDLYIMSKCPFGVQAAQGIKPIMDEIGGFVDLNFNYIAYMKEGKWAPMHGDPEHKGNIIQLCAIKEYPDQSKYLPFMDCINKEWRKIPEGWEGCAQKSGMDVAKIKSCYEGPEGEKLATASYEKSKQQGASGSPTIVLGGEKYQGGREKNDYLRAICPKISGAKPEACSKIPEPVEVKAIVLTDKRCKECQADRLISSLRGRFFPKLTVKTLDYSEEEGKKLYKELGEKFLPIFLFEAGVEKAEQYARLSRWMKPLGKYQHLAVPAKFDPTAEICDNKIDDTSDGKIDCEDQTCTGDLVCRKEITNKLDVFIMSQCPFGIKAIEAMKEVLPNFKGKLNFDVHYIADEQGDNFRSLHGQPEVDENLRQLCVKKHFKAKYMDYMWCRSKDYRSNEWKPCATGGIKAAVIEKCSAGDEGKKLLREDIKIAKQLDVSGSPTWLANNRHKFSGIAPDAIKSNVCQHNKALPNCDKSLTKDAKAQGSCGS